MRARALILLPLLLAVTSTPLLVPAPAHAASRVGVDNGRGGAAVDPTYATTLTLRGSGFQSVQGGFGGIYVLFGTVSGSWRPSSGGGGSTLYVPDSQARDNAGHQRFVAFPGGDTSAEANGGTIARDGSWSTTISVPGATFQAVDSAGEVRSVDCRRVTCGVITIGAHGVSNRANETFTPVRVADLQQGQAASPGAAAATPGATASAPAGSATEAPAAGEPSASAGAGERQRGRKQRVVAPTLEVDRASAGAGRVLAFTGTGLPAGRQVSVVMDDGEAGAGPFTVAADGTLAGVLQVPDDADPGTHELRLVGLADELAVRFALVGETTPVAASVGWQPRAFVGAAGLALLLALGVAVRRLVRGRRRA